MMPNISNEQPPEDTPDDLREYLSRMVININIAFAQGKKFPPVYVLPDKPENGNVEYFGRIIGGIITSVGFWGYEGGAWVKL